MDRFNHLNYIYEFGPGTETNIDTSFVKNMFEIKNELIKQTSSVNIIYSKYPKGFEILIEQYSDKIIYRTNYPLKEISLNEFVIQFPDS